MQFTIFRVPTTDIITPNDSCYLPEYKLAPTRYLINHMLTYLINGKRTQIMSVKKQTVKQNERNTHAKGETPNTKLNYLRTPT
jgi:hypothetical protein